MFIEGILPEQELFNKINISNHTFRYLNSKTSGQEGKQPVTRVQKFAVAALYLPSLPIKMFFEDLTYSIGYSCRYPYTVLQFRFLYPISLFFFVCRYLLVLNAAPRSPDSLRNSLIFYIRMVCMTLHADRRMANPCEIGTLEAYCAK